MKPILCLFGRHVWKVPRFTRLNMQPGEYDVQCTRCGKIESRWSADK